MPAPANVITTNDIDHALDIQMAINFEQGYDRLAEILDIFEPEVVAAGTAMYLYKVDGELNAEQVAEGEEVKRSHYTVKKVPIGEHTIRKYRKTTSAESILKSGYENSVIRTDRKMGQQARGEVIDDFFKYMAKGLGTVSGKNLQGALALADAALADAFEENHEEPGEFVHFVNRQDVAGYLAEAKVTTQMVFGMEYLQNFLGVKHMFISRRVPAGTVYVTDTNNIHVYGIDFSALAAAGLNYETQELGLIGVHHQGAYDHASAETDMIVGCDIIAETLDFIIIASFGDGAATASVQSDNGFDPEGDVIPTTAQKNDEIAAWAAAHDVSLEGCTTKAQMLDAIKAALDDAGDN